MDKQSHSCRLSSMKERSTGCCGNTLQVIDEDWGGGLEEAFLGQTIFKLQQ